MEWAGDGVLEWGSAPASNNPLLQLSICLPHSVPCLTPGGE
jgi:hypothetical protein